MTIFFIAGIDTDIGKTVATGLLSRYLLDRDVNVITQKMVQTGCDGMSEDIEMHRRIEGRGLLKEDLAGTTCPYLFSHAASPHLAADMEDKKIDPQKIQTATQLLEKTYDTVLLEGAGGLFVPLNTDTTILDYIRQQQYPVILVSSSKLGSINHTFLSLEALFSRNIPLSGVVYNCYPNTDENIEKDSKRQIAGFIKKAGFEPAVVEMRHILPNDPKIPDFSSILNRTLRKSPSL